MLSPKSHDLTLNLERTGQHITATAQPSKAKELFHHPGAPT